MEGPGYAPLLLLLVVTCVYGFSIPADICSLPPDIGPCREALTRYFYDSETGRCQNFTYGGCQGNENRFESLRECRANCSHNVSEDVCQLPQEIGPCFASMPRIFYNSTSERCEPFIYGGCRGNKNNFETLRECRATCNGTFGWGNMTFGWGNTTFGWGNTTFGWGNTTHPHVPVSEDVCHLPKVTGPCFASMHRFFYNSTSEKCEHFIYGGCRGNKNNFENPLECRAKCNEEKDACNLPPVTGPCRGAETRYFYNSVTGRCQNFTYGGCLGNGNRFESMRECQAHCSQNVCELPAETGPCRGEMRMFFFNATAKKCEKFTYGGCLGNGNRFETRDECKETCKNKSC